MSTSEEEPEECTKRVLAVKTSIRDIWKSEFIKPLYELINVTNKIVTHTYLFSKFIFTNEMEQTREFGLNNYVVKGFFVEVFLFLVQRQVRDGSKTGRSKLSALVILYRQLIAKYKDTYHQAANYTPPKLVHAQQIALYECTKMQTAYFNNIKAQFGNRLRMFLNGICKKMTEERYVDCAIQETIKRTVTLPCMKVKLVVAKKQMPNDEILNADAKNK
ncbi:hypothetical protein RMATCC62417_15013 [Rhizopus microsporus]|nr:hypothetical protein RMATCC62417_15013 [Rhizopus microsporus]